MTRAVLLSLALLAGCRSQVVAVRSPGVTGSAWAAPCGHVVTVDHVVPGQRVEVVTRRGRIGAEVIARAEGWVFLCPERPIKFVGCVEAATREGP